jgi:activator of HSP90 ATPase
VKNSEEVLASAENFHKPAIKDTTTSSSATKETPTSETPTSVTSEAPTSATSETSTSGTVTTTTSSAFTIDSSNNELDLKHYMLGGSDITALFRQYQNRADKILRPIILETYVQELLALGDVLFF